MEQATDQSEQQIIRPKCKNCGTKLSKKGHFCPGCGQRDFDGRVRMRDLLAKFFSNFTHLDNKFVKMCWHLFVPARVTISYFEGKIKRYPHPVQFFFIVMFFFLLMFSKQFEGSRLNTTGNNFNLQVSGEDTIINDLVKNKLAESGLFPALQHYVTAKKYREQFDSMPQEWRTPNAKLLLDSVVRKMDGPWEEAGKVILSIGKDSIIDGPLSQDSLLMNFVFSNVSIGVVDLIELSPEAIIEKYGISAWDQKIALRQGIKSLKDPERLIHQYVGSFGWAILVLISCMALVLKLLYWKRGGYYVEHFIFLMHQQSGAFLLITLGMVIQDYLFKLELIWLLIFGWIGFGLLWAMKRYYGESWPWTLLKWGVYSLVYIFGLAVLFIATLLVVFVLF